MKCGYKYRFYPTAEQQQILAQTFGCVRFVYNWALKLKTEAFYEKQQKVSNSQLSSAVTILKTEEKTAWLKDVSRT